MNFSVFLLFLISACTVSAAEVGIAVKNENGLLKAEISPEDGIDYGKLPPDGKSTASIKIENRLSEDISFGEWRSPCPCLAFNSTPKSIKAGAKANAHVLLDGTGYQGAFLKYLMIHVSSKTLGETNFFVPVRFSVDDGNFSADAGVSENPAPAADSSGKAGTIFVKDGLRIEFLEYRKGIGSQENADAWVFAEKACPACNLVKHELLPELFKKASMPGGKVVVVDLDEPENMLLLAEFEEQLNIRGDRMPVLLWKNELVYGLEAIKDFIRQYDAGRHVVESKLRAAVPEVGEGALLEKCSGKITVAAIVISGLLDGINPCVFSMLVFFISLLSVSGMKGGRLISVGAVYCLACLITYFMLGLGILEFLRIFKANEILKGVLNCVMLGVLFAFAAVSFRDAWLFMKTERGSDVLLRLPDRLRSLVHHAMRGGLSGKFLLAGVFAVGVIVTLVESVCTGQVYIPTLALLIRQDSVKAKWISYLALYNIMFIVPLVGIFIAAYYGTGRDVFLRWSRRNVVIGKAAMGVFLVVLGVLLMLV